MAEPPIVLVIEDDPLVRFSITAFLEDSGFICLEAEDGGQGLETFAKTEVDAVVTDYRMPRLDGFGVLKALRERSPRTPVVFLTGNEEPEVAKAALAAGAGACLHKPLVAMESLVATLRALLQLTNPQGGVS